MKRLLLLVISMLLAVVVAVYLFSSESHSGPIAVLSDPGGDEVGTAFGEAATIKEAAVNAARLPNSASPRVAALQGNALLDYDTPDDAKVPLSDRIKEILAMTGETEDDYRRYAEVQSEFKSIMNNSPQNLFGRFATDLDPEVAADQVISKLLIPGMELGKAPLDEYQRSECRYIVTQLIRDIRTMTKDEFALMSHYKSTDGWLRFIPMAVSMESNFPGYRSLDQRVQEALGAANSEVVRVLGTPEAGGYFDIDRMKTIGNVEDVTK